MSEIDFQKQLEAFKQLDLSKFKPKFINLPHEHRRDELLDLKNYLDQQRKEIASAFGIPVKALEGNPVSSGAEFFVSSAGEFKETWSKKRFVILDEIEEKRQYPYEHKTYKDILSLKTFRRRYL